VVPPAPRTWSWKPTASLAAVISSTVRATAAGLAPAFDLLAFAGAGALRDGRVGALAFAAALALATAFVPLAFAGALAFAAGALAFAFPFAAAGAGATGVAGMDLVFVLDMRFCSFDRRIDQRTAQRKPSPIITAPRFQRLRVVVRAIQAGPVGVPPRNTRKSSAISTVSSRATGSRQSPQSP
jgi:hypothetical protein